MKRRAPCYLRGLAALLTLWSVLFVYEQCRVYSLNKTSLLHRGFPSIFIFLIDSQGGMGEGGMEKQIGSPYLNTRGSNHLCTGLPVSQKLKLRASRFKQIRWEMMKLIKYNVFLRCNKKNKNNLSKSASYSIT